MIKKIMFNVFRYGMGYMLSVLGLLLLFSCSTMNCDCPVYVSLNDVSLPKISFSCMNVCNDNVVSLEVGFDVFDVTNENPKFVKHIDLKVEGYIESGETKTFEKSMIGSLPCESNNKFEISNLYVKEVIFENSIVWKNKGVIIG